MQLEWIVYGVGKRTSSSSNAVRHIDDGNGLPLCWHKTRTGRGRGSGYVRDYDVVTCKRCLAIRDQAGKE